MTIYTPGSVEADYAGAPQWKEVLRDEGELATVAGDAGRLAVTSYQQEVALRPARLVSAATAAAEAAVHARTDRDPVYSD